MVLRSVAVRLRQRRDGDPVAGDKIYRATDTYRAGSYDCKTRTTVLCKGDRGILY